VVDAAFRRPVGRFTVAVLWNGERHGSIQPVTREFQDAEGRFELDAIPTGPHSVFVRAEGFATWRTSVTLPAEVAPVLAQGADVRGLVRDHATGDPVEGALVISETDAPVASLAPEAAAVPPGTRGALTGPDGTFSLESLSTGTQVLRASAPGRAPAWARLTLAPGERREVALRLPRGGGIRGRVTLSDQTPMADVNIVAYWGETAYPNGPCTIATTKTEADGRYILTHLPEGAWSVLCFDQESKSPSAPSIRMVEVRGSGFTTVDFMGEPGTTLHGVVRNGAGEPIAKFAFSLTKRDGSHGDTMRMGGSREDGSYEVRDVAPGLYDVFNVRMLGTGLTWIGEVEIGAGPRQEQNFTVGALRIAGRVSDGTTGEPLPDAVVIIEVLQVPQGAGRFAAKALIASDGSYEAVGLPAGIYRVIAYSGAGRLGYEVLDPVVLGDGAGVAEANLRLFPGGTVAVQVVSADGWPVKGALVTLIDRAGNPITFATEQKTDAQGLYEARGLRPGLWRVAAARPGGPRVENRVVVRPEATHRLVLTLP
jgi:hypothetical protein